MRYLRLLAGLTSFISKRWRSHFWARGPAGILAFSCMPVSSLVPFSGRAVQSLGLCSLTRSIVQQDGQGDRAVAHHNDGGDRYGEGANQSVIAPAIEPQRLEPAAGPMPQVQAQEELGNDV